MNNNKNNNIGCLGAILGTLVVVVCVVIYAVLSSLICNVTVSARLGGEIACALLPLSMTVIVISFVLFEVIFIAYELAKIKGNDADGAAMKKLFRIVTPICIGLSLLLAVFHANTYTKLTEDSVSKVCFTEYKSYSWSERNDVMRYTLACDADGNLTYTLTMKDSEKIELFSSVNSCSDEFIEKHENLYGYAAYLTEEFNKGEYIIEGKVIGEEHMEKHYKDLQPKIWKHLETIIKITKES